MHWRALCSPSAVRTNWLHSEERLFPSSYSEILYDGPGLPLCKSIWDVISATSDPWGLIQPSGIWCPNLLHTRRHWIIGPPIMKASKEGAPRGGPKGLKSGSPNGGPRLKKGTGG
jgi:hypothetical protein